MRKRFLLPLLLFFLPATIIGAAYAGFVYSNKVDTKTDSNSGKIDDVKPNFKLDENNYTIYFFPSAQAARINFESPYDLPSIKQKILNETPYKDDKKNKDPTNNNGAAWGFWPDKTGNEGYFPKVINTIGGPSISLEQFESIGEPSTNGYDKKTNLFGSYTNEFNVAFSGWTAVRSSSISGYASQGEYSYISAFDDLTKLDSESNDGTKTGDKVLFVYPIFTSGKDYDNPNNAVQLAETSNPDSTTVRYLSRKDNSLDSTHFYYNNLIIENNDIWSLSFAGKSNLSGWYGEWGKYRNDANYFIYKKDTLKSAIISPGIYNIHVYLQRNSSGTFDENIAKSSTFNTEVSSKLMPLIYEDDFSNPNLFYVRMYEIGTFVRYFWMFVKVEKVYEFKLAGTEGRGFTFDTAGQLYVSRFSSGSDATLGGLWKMYYLDNVFMEKGKNNLFTEYTNSNGNKYKIRNTVFSFLPSDENLATINGIQPMNPAELNYVNANEPDENVRGNYKGVSTSSESTYKKIKKEDVPPESADYSEYIKNPENLPNYAPGKDYANYFFASEFKYSCFCKILIKVDFDTIGDNKGKPTSIRVAIAPYHTNAHKVYVYPDETNLVLFRDPETKLIDPENNSTLKAIELTSFEMQASDDYKLKDQQITLRNNTTGNSTSMLLSEYLNKYDVIDHLTNKKIEIGKSYKRHMACWQKDKTNK